MSRKVAMFFASLSFVIMLIYLSVDLAYEGISDPVYVLKLSSFSAVVFAFIGYYLGKVFDAGKEVSESNPKALKEKDKELIIDDILVYDIGVKRNNESKQEDTSSPQ
ncbi:MAG: hypothetical protein PHE78_04170 [Candidatus Gastranaerophilales bacterium]|nr:hypothetical protein [Candidatus Gastranaerophilales bacterium]